MIQEDTDFKKFSVNESSDDFDEHESDDYTHRSDIDINQTRSLIMIRKSTTKHSFVNIRLGSQVMDHEVLKSPIP